MADEIRGFSPGNAQRIARVVPRLEAWPDGPRRSLPRPEGPLRVPAGVWIRNAAEEEIPRHAVMAVVDDEFDNQAGFEQLVLVVEKPSTTFRRVYLVNGFEPIPDGQKWFIPWQPLPRFAYDASWVSPPPAQGEAGGSKPDSWLLWKNYPAICTVAGVRDAVNKILQGELHEINTWVGKTTGPITGGTSSTTSYRFYTTAGGLFSGADAGFTTVPSAYSKVDIDSGLFVKITLLGNVALLEPLACNA